MRVLPSAFVMFRAENWIAAQLEVDWMEQCCQGEGREGMLELITGSWSQVDAKDKAVNAPPPGL